MSLIKDISEKIEKYLSNHCKEDGCDIKLNVLKKNSLILDINKCNIDNTEHCDCIILTFLEKINTIFMNFIELKGKRPNVFKVLRQLQNCCEYFESKLKNDAIIEFDAVKLNFLPVLISKSVGNLGIKILKSISNKINFFNNKEFVITASCGSYLESIFKKKYLDITGWV